MACSSPIWSSVKPTFQVLASPLSEQTEGLSETHTRLTHQCRKRVFFFKTSLSV